MEAPDINEWIKELKARKEIKDAGMILIHRGIVRGVSRSGRPVRALKLSVDRKRLEEVLKEAKGWKGIVEVRAWVNEGVLSVSDDIMMVLVAGDIRENVFDALQKLVGLIKREVVTEQELE